MSDESDAGRWRTSRPRRISLALTILLAGVAIVMAVYVSPLAFAADSIAVSTSASPTQDIAMTITVTGTASGSDSLFVFVETGTPSSCAANPSDDGGTELSGSGYGGDPLAAGSYSESYSFSPPNAGTYTVCAYLDDYSFDPPDATGTASFTASAPTASVAFAVSADPVQNVPATITVSGSTQVARSLWVFVETGTPPSCAANPSDDGGTELSGSGYGSDAVAAGNFTKTYTFTPPSAGTYTLCGYVDDYSFDPPDATGTASFTASAPTASVAFAVSADPVQNVPATITVSGSTQVARSLWVFVETGTPPSCAANPSDDGGTELSGSGYGSDAVAAGNFTKTYTFTPPSAGTYTLCGYVDDYSFDPPDATGNTTLSASLPAASVSVTPQTPVIGHPTAIGITGTTELGSQLFAYADPSGASCAAAASLFSLGISDNLNFPDAAISLTAAAGDPIAAGVFSKTYEFTPSTFGTYTLCAYVYDSTGAGAATFSIGAAQLLSPANRVTGPELNPTFTWQAGANESFAVIFSRESGGQLQDLVKIGPNRYTELSGAGSGSTHGVASLSFDGTGKGSLHLDQPLPPGTYAWRVESSAPSGASTHSGERWITVTGPRLKTLSVRVQQHPGTISKYPGYTVLQIVSTPYSTVTIRFSHQGRETGDVVQHWGNTSSGGFEIRWTCGAPGGVYRYQVTARDAEGDHKAAFGSFSSVTAAQCAAMEARERAAAQAQAQAQLRAEEQAKQEAAAQQEAQYQRFLYNCRALGGTPVTLDIGGAPETFCRSPYGGYISVPY